METIFHGGKGYQSQGQGLNQSIVGERGFVCQKLKALIYFSVHYIALVNECLMAFPFQSFEKFHNSGIILWKQFLKYNTITDICLMEEGKEAANCQENSTIGCYANRSKNAKCVRFLIKDNESIH